MADLEKRLSDGKYRHIRASVPIFTSEPSLRFSTVVANDAIEDMIRALQKIGCEIDRIELDERTIYFKNPVPLAVGDIAPGYRFVILRPVKEPRDLVGLKMHECTIHGVRVLSQSPIITAGRTFEDSLVIMRIHEVKNLLAAHGVQLARVEVLDGQDPVFHVAAECLRVMEDIKDLPKYTFVAAGLDVARDQWSPTTLDTANVIRTDDGGVTIRQISGKTGQPVPLVIEHDGKEPPPNKFTTPGESVESEKRYERLVTVAKDFDPFESLQSGRLVERGAIFDLLASDCEKLSVSDGDVLIFRLPSDTPERLLGAFRRHLYKLSQERGWIDRGIVALAFPDLVSVEHLVLGRDVQALIEEKMRPVLAQLEAARAEIVELKRRIQGWGIRPKAETSPNESGHTVPFAVIDPIDLFNNTKVREMVPIMAGQEWVNKKTGVVFTVRSISNLRVQMEAPNVVTFIPRDDVYEQFYPKAVD